MLEPQGTTKPRGNGLMDKTHPCHWQFQWLWSSDVRNSGTARICRFCRHACAGGENAPAADEIRALAQRERLSAHVVEMDVTDDTSVEQAIESIVGITGRLDVVVNNAGIAYSGPPEAFTIDQIQDQFDTNVFSVLRVNGAVLPHMRRQHSGLLLQIGSLAGRVALPFIGLYAATKFALEGLTESYRDELAPFGIDADIIEPGTYPTPYH